MSINMGGGSDDSQEEEDIQNQLMKQREDEAQKEAKLQQDRLNAIRRGSSGQSLFGPSTDNLQQLLGG